MSDFRYCIRKFIEKQRYWVNCTSSTRSIDLVTNDPLKKFFRFWGGKSSKPLTELSNWESW